MPRISRAAARRLAAEHAAAAATPRALPKELADHLAGYVPQRVDPAIWAAICSDHTAAMSRSSVVGLSSFQKRCSEAALYLAHRHERSLSTAVADAFTFESIDSYYRQLEADRLSTRNDRRSRLRKLATDANPGIDTPVAAPVHGHVAVKAPYDRREELAIMRVASRQRLPHARRTLSAVVGLSGGAGLDALDYRHLTRSHITVTDNGIRVDVPGKRPRTVWVRVEYEALVLIGVEGLQLGQLVLGEKRDRRNITGPVIERAEIHGNVPHIEASRLRNTWLAWAMTQAIPLNILLDAAGLTSCRSLIDLLPHVPSTDLDVSALRHASHATEMES